MNEQPAVPTKRSPEGFVAQRILALDGKQDGARGPWLLTCLNANQMVEVQVLTDEEVADWEPLYDEIKGDNHGELT